MLAVLCANPIGRFRAHQPDIDRQKRDRHGQNKCCPPPPDRHHERDDRPGKRGADSPGGAVDTEHEAAQASGPGFGDEHGTDRPLTVQRKAHDAVDRDEAAPRRRQRHQRHRQREHRNVDGEDIATAKPVGEPGPEIKADDADQRRDLQTTAVGAEIDREFPHQHRRHERQDRAVHAVEAPAEAIGPSDVPMRRGDPARIGDVAIETRAEMLRLQRAGSCDRARIRRDSQGVSPSS